MFSQTYKDIYKVFVREGLKGFIWGILEQDLALRGDVFDGTQHVDLLVKGLITVTSRANQGRCESWKLKNNNNTYGKNALLWFQVVELFTSDLIELSLSYLK